MTPPHLASPCFSLGCTPESGSGAMASRGRLLLRAALGAERAPVDFPREAPAPQGEGRTRALRGPGPGTTSAA